MRKLLLLAFFFNIIALSAIAQSEDFHAFKFDIGLGYASPLNKSTNSSTYKAGATITFHPHYRLSNQLAVGLRLETALLGSEDYDAATDTYSNGQVSVLNSYCLTGEYYLSDETFRPFVGIGAGVFNRISAAFTTDTIFNASVGNKFGVFPSLGFEVWHFRMEGTYNYLPDRAGYWGIKAAFFFGGGRKEGSGGSSADHRSRRISNWGG